MPLAKACTNTATSGTNRNSVRKASARPISVRRTQAGSLTASATRAGASGRTSGPASATASLLSMTADMSAPLTLAGPGLQQVDQQQQQEGRHQHHDGDRGRADVVVLLELGDDQQRGD